MAHEGDKHLAPAKIGERVNPDRQYMYAREDEREQGDKVMQFAIDDARPVGRLQAECESQSYCHR